MTEAERKEGIREFCEKWKNKGQEDKDDRSYWIDIFTKIMGIPNATDYLDFQKRVKFRINGKRVTKKIDVYIPETKVLIEQKSLGIPLDKKLEQSDGEMLTAFEQADRYRSKLLNFESADWIITSNFTEIWIYNMNEEDPQPSKILLSELDENVEKLDFLINSRIKKLNAEMRLSIKAGELVGLIYDALKKEYINPDSKESLASLNILCVRLVFCLYAEDAHLFGPYGNEFHEYLNQFKTEDLRRAIKDLFKILDTKKEDRDLYENRILLDFPYVNGGLFEKEDIEIPQLTEEIRSILLSKASEGFNWSDISPTIFGAVFESTLNQDTRRKGGMHYTSVKNIHRPINPLFLDEINREFYEIYYDLELDDSRTEEQEELWKELYETELDIRTHGTRAEINKLQNRLKGIQGNITKRKNVSITMQIERLTAFQEKLASLKFLDPACGSGNFLTESYLALRKIENKIIAKKNELDALYKLSDKEKQKLHDNVPGQIELFTDNKELKKSDFIKVSIEQFYGIEVNDFAVTVAKTALWIAESQMLKETEHLLHQSFDFLPLQTNAYIVEKNALDLDWNDVISNNEIDYIMGNPPFVGQAYRTKEQSDDMQRIFGKQAGLCYLLV